MGSGFGFSVVAAIALCAGMGLGAHADQSTGRPVGVPGASKDGGQKGKQVTKVEGILTAVTVAADGSGTITIQPKRGKPVIVPIDVTTQLEENEMEITVADLVLAIGDFAEATISKATGVAVKVEIGE
jgi:hypothetical protein